MRSAASLPALLLTGSSGQLGAEIARQLEGRYEIRGLDLRPGPATRILARAGDRAALAEALQGAAAVIHTASLHAPHVATHSRQAFIETNISATLALLEEACRAGVRRFVYTSSTSIYGHAMEDPEHAVWVSEALAPQPRDIYDISKLAAEELCKDFARSEGLDVICLRASRFWEEDLADRVWYRMYRGVDAEDVAQAHALALESPLRGFHRFNISARPLFQPEDLSAIRQDARPLIAARAPEILSLYAQRGWPLPREVDRVYSIEAAEAALGYRPRWNAREMAQALG